MNQFNTTHNPSTNKHHNNTNSTTNLAPTLTPVTTTTTITKTNIIQTVFFLDTNINSIHYTIEANDAITLTTLKQMLAMSSQRARNTIRLIEKHTNEEYNESYDEYTLSEIFPSQSKIEFIVKNQENSKFKVDSLKVGQTCPQHNEKYCMFYCYDCEKSICMQCITITNAHTEHNIIEKQDLIGPSDKLVENLFSGLEDLVNNLNQNRTNKDEINHFKNNMKMTYFPTLRNLIDTIENKFNSLIDKYNIQCEESMNLVSKNTNNFKQNCIDGLDELKQKINIENVMADEGVFLQFDFKLKELSLEKSKIESDLSKIKTISNSYTYLKLKIETAYEDIKNYLVSFIDKFDVSYNEVIKNVSNVKFNSLNKDEILVKLLKDVNKQRNGKSMFNKNDENYKASVNKMISNQQHNTNLNVSTLDTSNISNIGYMFRGNGNENNINTNNTNTNNNANNINNINTNRQSNTSNNLINIINNHNNNPNNPNNNRNTIIPSSFTHPNNLNTNTQDISNIMDSSQLPEENLSTTSDSMFIHPSSRKLNSSKVFICNPIADTRNVIIFSSDKSNNTESVLEKEINMNMLFFYEMAFINTGKVCYISGGRKTTNIAENTFIKYNPSDYTHKVLKNSIYSKYGHSLLYSKDYVYSIGGYKSNTCEKYDLNINSWIKMNNMIENERQTPILYIHGSWLYAFCGYKIGEYINTVERVNKKSMKGKWEYVMYKNPENLELKMYGAGLIPIKEGSVFILGGKTANGAVASAIDYDFSENTFSKLDFGMDDNGFFSESLFIPIEEKEFCLFNISSNQVLKLTLS